MTACLYCGGPGATFRVNEDAVAHRACAWAADDADQALTFSMLSARQFAPEVLEAPLALRLVRQVEDLAGRRFGRLTAIGLEVVEFCGIVRRAWRIRCDCGVEGHATGSRLLRDPPRECRACARATEGARRRGAAWALADHAGLSHEGARNRLRRAARRAA
jgi:hypothetical protein